MFLKQIQIGEEIKFQYRNSNEDVNTIVVASMQAEINFMLVDICQIYTDYLQTACELSKLQINIKKDSANVVVTVSTSINGVSGGFSFQHEFARAGEAELKELESQELYEACNKYKLLNSAYDKIIGLSEFLEENLIKIQGVDVSQLELF